MRKPVIPSFVLLSYHSFQRSSKRRVLATPAECLYMTNDNCELDVRPCKFYDFESFSFYNSVYHG
jgi:hypothetical protein